LGLYPTQKGPINLFYHTLLNFCTENGTLRVSFVKKKLKKKFFKKISSQMNHSRPFKKESFDRSFAPGAVI